MFSKLEKYLNKNHKITLVSEIDDDEEIYHGYIVGLSRNFVCLWSIVDCHNDGFLIMPIKYVTDVICGKYEKAYHRILRLEGCLDDVSKPSWLKIGSYKSILKSLEENHNNLIVESRLPSVDEFVIGKIKSITDKEVILNGFDATAKWQEGSYKVPFNEITLIKFGDEYSSVFRKYVS